MGELKLKLHALIDDCADATLLERIFEQLCHGQGQESLAKNEAETLMARRQAILDGKSVTHEEVVNRFRKQG